MVIPLSQSLPRFFRYNIGNRMLDLILDMMSLIYQANGNTPLEAMNFIASFQKEKRNKRSKLKITPVFFGGKHKETFPVFPLCF